MLGGVQDDVELALRGHACGDRPLQSSTWIGTGETGDLLHAQNRGLALFWAYGLEDFVAWLTEGPGA